MDERLFLGILIFVASVASFGLGFLLGLLIAKDKGPRDPPSPRS